MEMEIGRIERVTDIAEDKQRNTDADLVRLFNGVMPRGKFDRLPPVEQAALITGESPDQIKLGLALARSLRD